MYSSENDRLVHPLKESDDGLRDRYVCDEEASRFALCNSHYTIYVYSRCNFATQVVVTSPLPNNNLTIIGPRLLAGAGFTPVKSVHSGLVAYFEPQIGVNGSLAIGLQNSSETGHALKPIYDEDNKEGYFIVGISGLLKFNSSATLRVHTLGGIRTICDFSEGPGLLEDVMRDAVNFNELEYGLASIDRSWLNNVTSTTLTFTHVDENGVITVKDRKLHFRAGTDIFNASFNYPQLTQLPPENTLAESANGLVEEEHYIVQGLAFLSSSGRFLAGAWRFLTYFGRGSVISVLLVESILSHGKNISCEAGISAGIERIDPETGAAAHDETISDYATKRNNFVYPLEADVVAEWRGSAYGFGGGRISYDANAIVPDGRRAGAALAEAGFFPGHLDCAKKRRALPRLVKTRH
ncbi:glycogen debranching enzyme [Colletotrichum sp. SAR 10_77]|nr:glycogen debranching enzyme [Colletotrichum sp. SAR 10_77]